MSDSIDNLSVTSRYQDGEYLKKNRDWHVEGSPWKALQIEKIINKNNLNLDSICEIGCGAGEILLQLSLNPKFNSVSFFGYEQSKIAFDLCKKRETESLKFFYENILDQKIQYRAILCFDVFENDDNYMVFLKILKNRGKYKIFHIPLDLSVSSLLRGSIINSRDSVGHLHYFTPDIALATLKDCGYEILDIMFTPSFRAESPKSFKEKLAKIPRSFLYLISPKLMSTLVGGASLMVLTK
jgi:hypothetical protein